MPTSVALRAANDDLWRRLHAHPFVVAASEGRLARDAFDRWLVEDRLFVLEARRFLRRLVEMAPDEPARDLLAGGITAFTAELDLFRREADARGLDFDVEPCPTNLGYSSFVAASSLEGFTTAVTVLYGMEKAYLDAWTTVREQASRDSPYWPFIDNWSSPGFVDWVGAIADVVDEAAPEADAELYRAFRRVVRFELRFWDAVHAGETW